MRPFGCKSDQGKVLQLVQRGTDKRIPVELVKQPSGEVLDPTELEGLNVMVSSESGSGIATIPHTIEDGKLVVEVTADISQHLGLGVYMMTATGRIPDPTYADGYHDYEVVVPLCKVTKYGSNETPVKVTANVLEGLKGEKGDSAYQSYLDTTADNPKKTLPEWLASHKGEKGDSAYQSYLDTTADNPKKTLPEWLASHKGEKGDSAYQIYLATTKDDPKMTEEEWATGGWLVVLEMLKKLRKSRR